VSDWDIFPTVEGPLSNAKTRITVRPPSVPAEARPVLDYIAKSESPGYNYMYGGGRFEELNDHPRRNIPIQSGPNVGRTSSAAGRYQFLQGTWDEQAKKLGLTDFSPESQDAAAWDLASTTYRTKTGRDLLTDVKAGNTRDIGPALSGVWTSLPGGIEPNRQTAQFGGGRSPMGAPQQDQQPQAMGFAPEQQRQFPPQSPQSPLSGVTASQAATGSWDAFPAAPQAAPPQAAPAPSQSQAAAPESSQLRAALEGLRSGMTFNFGDEIAGVGAASGLPGVARAVVPPGMNEIIGLARLGYEYLSDQQGGATSSYKTARDEVRGAQQAAQKDHPGTYLGTNILGAVAMPIGGLASAATLPARIGRGAIIGSGMGAAAGAGAGEDLGSRVTGAASGGAVGAGLGAAAPVALKGLELGAGAVGAALRPITTAIRGARDPEAEAARRVMVARNRDVKAGDAGLSDAEFASSQAAGVPVANVDQGGSVTRSLARSAANTSPEARGALERMTSDRFEGQGPRAAQFLAGLVSTRANATWTREALEKTAQTARKPYYDRAYRDGAGGIWDRELSELSQAPAMQDAVKAATTQAQNRSASGRAGSYLSPNQQPTLEFWDLVKRQIDQKINVARRAGEKEDVMELNDLRSILVKKLDTAVPSYATARGVAAELFKASNALEAGEMFVTSGKIHEVAKAMSKMSPEERELFAEGFVSSFIDKVNKVGDRRSILNQIQQSTDAKNRFNIVLGTQKSKELEAFLRTENIMDRMRGALGNSTTARQLVEAGLAGGATGIYTGDLTSAGTAAGLVFALRSGSKLLNERIDQNVSRRVGEMLASNDPKILQKGVALVSKSPQLMKMLRAADNAAARVGGQQSASVPLLQSVGAGRAEEDQPSVPGRGR
jgi:muramidase (phage lysozyme)